MSFQIVPRIDNNTSVNDFSRICFDARYSEDLYDLSQGGKNGTTALHQAAAFGNLILIKYFLSKNKSLLEKEDWNFRTPLFSAVEFNQCEAAKLLLSMKANPNACTYEGRTLLATACQRQFDSLAALLKEHGAVK